MGGDSFNFIQGGQDCSKQIANLKRELQLLRGDFLNAISAGYMKVFSTSGTNNAYTVYFYKHKLSRVTSVIILDQDGVEVDVWYRIGNDYTVYIESNLPLINFTVILN